MRSRAVRVDYSRLFLWIGGCVFALSVAGLAGFFGVFLYYDTDFWYHFDVRDVLRVASAALTGVAVSSGLLIVLLKREHAYSSFGETFFAVCLFISLCNLLWLAPVLLFG